MPNGKAFWFSVFCFLFILSAVEGFPVFCLSTSAAVSTSTSFWQTEKSAHFILYYQDIPSGYVQELLNKAEAYYNGIVDNFGFTRFEFWSWDRRAKIYLYRSESDYLKDTKQTAGSGAAVEIKNRTIKTFIGQEKFFDSVLPHEMAHIVFREFAGNKNLPLWLDEGIACSQEERSLDERIRLTADLLKRGAYIEFEKLALIKDYSLVSADIFYAQSCSIIVFLLKQYGRERFLDFSRQLRDGKIWQEAITGVYQFKDMDEFEERWKKYIEELKNI